MGVDWNNVLDAGTRGVLERQALVPFLRRQRWMVPAAREIRQARFADWTPLRTGANPSFLAVVAVEYADGGSESCLRAAGARRRRRGRRGAEADARLRARADHRRAQGRDRRRAASTMTRATGWRRLIDGGREVAHQTRQRCAASGRRRWTGDLQPGRWTPRPGRSEQHASHSSPIAPC